ncbi:MAG: AI-2E family transporter [Oscillochloris sp.]|nr:AI-2E family transporter [Oscillochloris sp.]
MPTFQIPWRAIARWLLVFAALYGVGWLLWSARSALTPFLVGVILAYLLLPLVNRFDRSMPRWAAILSVYVLGIVVVTLFFSFLLPPLIDQVNQLIRSTPSIDQLQLWADQLIDEYEQLLATLPPAIEEQVRAGISSALSQGLDTIRSNLVDYVRGLGTFLVNSVLSVVNTVTFLLGFFLIPFWLFYVLMDHQNGIETIDKLIYHRLRADFWALMTIIDKVFSGYLRGQLILGTAVGTAAGGGLLILSMFGLEVDYILLLAVIAGITELVPVIGPILGAIPAVILGFIDSPTTGIAVLILYILIQQLENNFLVPRIVGESVGIHPAVLMVLLVVCAQVFGLLGAILSAPLGAVSRDVLAYLFGRLSDPPRPAGLLPDRLREVITPPSPVMISPKPLSDEVVTTELPGEDLEQESQAVAPKPDQSEPRDKPGSPEPA